ncbi:hypothetical protein SteCoe_2481 [Stentor coeruleus]|uniref:Vta1/callose synthase N-terminal domain-containing protein n=1 Tax=Stentor coeruleus TaxID=5963 RepID=A0A1R2CZJ0_9CILI|nr:hypothetical protein SteCoe_2481 [Stentor coeruleus]
MEGIPEEIANIKPFLIRSEEMKNADAVVSFYTFRYAMSLAFDFRKQNPGIQNVDNYLGKMLGVMEEKQKTIASIQNPKEQYEKFITMLFISADTDDRKTGSTKATAQKFLILSYFIEAFNVFQEIPQDWEEKRIYCKWKAADILKAIKKGEKPLPGGPNERGNEEKKAPAPVRSNQPIGNFPTESIPKAPNNMNSAPNPPNNSFIPSSAPSIPPNNTYFPSSAPSLPQNINYLPPSAPTLPQNTSYFPANVPENTKPTMPNPPKNNFKTPEPEPQRPAPVFAKKDVPERRTASNKSAITPEQRKILDQAKKFGTNGILELDYKNFQQAIIAFQNAIKCIESLNVG